MRAKETTLDALMAKMKIELRQSEVDTKERSRGTRLHRLGTQVRAHAPAAPRRTPPLRLHRTGQGHRRFRLEKPRSRRWRTRPQLPRRTPRRRQCRRPRRLASSRRRHVHRGPPDSTSPAASCSNTASAASTPPAKATPASRNRLFCKEDWRIVAPWPSPCGQRNSRDANKVESSHVLWY